MRSENSKRRVWRFVLFLSGIFKRRISWGLNGLLEDHSYETRIIKSKEKEAVKMGKALSKMVDKFRGHAVEKLLLYGVV